MSEKELSLFSKIKKKKETKRFSSYIKNPQEINLSDFIDSFPKIKKDIRNLQVLGNKIFELGEKLIDLGATNGEYHPGYVNETSLVDKSGRYFLIEGIDMDGSLLINTKTGKLEDCLGNRYSSISDYLKSLVGYIDKTFNNKEILGIWRKLKPLLIK